VIALCIIICSRLFVPNILHACLTYVFIHCAVVVPNNPSPTSQPSQSSQPSSRPSESSNPTVYNPDTSTKPSDEPNSPPIAIDDFVITEYEKFANISVLDNDFDPDGDDIAIDFVLTKQPDHGLGIVMPGSIFYYPEAKFTGVDVFAYMICDTNGLCDEANVSVTVLPPTNNAPVANDDFVSIQCGEAIDVRVLDNDYDDDGDDLTVELIVPPLFGDSVVNIADGTIQYTSNGINCGSADIFLYEICDTLGSCDHAMVHVTVAVPTSQGQSDCVGKVNVCLALDMSGSVCSPDFNDPQMCQECPGACNEDPFDQGTCCSNFHDVRTFAIDMIGALDQESSGVDEYYSVVEFATEATIVSNLISSDEAVQKLNGLDYSGGWTNHRSAIYRCQRTLDLSTADDRENVILLVTDGVPTRPEEDPHGAALAAASNVKSKGTVIFPVFISANNQGAVDYMEGLSTDGSVSYLNDFSELQQLVNSLAPQIACRTAIPSSSPSLKPTQLPTPLPTAIPTKLPTKEPTQGPTKQPVVANNPPIAVNDYASVERHGSVDVPVLLNDFDVDGDSFKIVAVSSSSCGTADINSASGTITYTSNGDACGGVDTFQYSICDESNDCSSATVHITVNSPPLVANDDNISVQCGNPIVIPVLMNDSYDDDGSITIVAMTDPNNGNAVVNAGQETITYTSDASCVAEDVFSYLACTEGYDKCDEATVTVAIVETANEEINTDSPTIFPSSKPSLTPSIAPSSMPSSSPTRGEWYYPNWDPEKEICVNDENPDWILDVQYENYSYKSKEECCHEHFWWRITQCMENQHSMYYNDGDNCQQRVYFDNHESKFTPGYWDHTILYFSMEECCVNTHWWDMPGCMAGSPLQYSFTFRIKIDELKDPEFCQQANLQANTLRKALENGLGNEETMVNVTTVGNATLTRDFETGNPTCGGSLEGMGWIGDTNGREDTSPANGATSAIEIEITSTCQHSKTEEEIDQEMEDMIRKVQFFVESGGYQIQIQQWSRTRDPPVKSLWPTEVDADSFEVLSTHNPFRVIRNNPYYPDWTTHQTCINDGLQAPYMNEDLNKEYYVFDTLEDCCNTWFSYDEGCKIDTDT
jgi:hypothetical protein